MTDIIYVNWSHILQYDKNLLHQPDLKPDARRALEISSIPNLEGYLFDRYQRISVDPIKSNKIVPHDIPSLPDQELIFSQCLDVIMTEILDQHNNSSIFFAWSGGIDSTALVCAMIRNANKDTLDRITILCSHDSVQENPYFFHRIIRPTFHVADINKFKIDPEFITSGSIMMDGECGNQINLGYWTYDLAVSGQWDLLESPFKDVALCEIIGIDAATPGLSDLRDILFASAESAPIDIKSVYDLTWWSNFNFKFDYVKYRKGLPTYTQHLTPVQTKIFFEQCLVHAYAHPLMQQWAMSSLDQRRRLDRSQTVKYFQKDYIFQTDKNPYYYRYKPEQCSMAEYFLGHGSYPALSDVFAVTESYQKLSFFDQQHRQILRQWLFESS